jgi:hypothetical protein
MPQPVGEAPRSCDTAIRRHGQQAREETAMRIQRIAMMVLLAGLIAGPVAYMQFNSVVEGADLLLAAFDSGELQLAAVPN